MNKRIIVYTSGTFDLFHSNHLKMIKYAKGLGDVLIVGVNTDSLVATFKASPVIPFEERIAIIEALKYSDIAIPQYTLDHTERVKNLNIDIFVVGDDWLGRYDYLRDLGITVCYFPYSHGISSTKLKQKIIDNYAILRTNIDKCNTPDTIQ